MIILMGAGEILMGHRENLMVPYLHEKSHGAPLEISRWAP